MLRGLIKHQLRHHRDKRKLTSCQGIGHFQETGGYLKGVSYIHFRCDSTAANSPQIRKTHEPRLWNHFVRPRGGVSLLRARHGELAASAIHISLRVPGMEHLRMVEGETACALSPSADQIDAGEFDAICTGCSNTGYGACFAATASGGASLQTDCKLQFSHAPTRTCRVRIGVSKSGKLRQFSSFGLSGYPRTNVWLTL